MEQPKHFQDIEFKPLNNVYRVDSYRDYLCLLYAKPTNSDLSREHWKVVEINTYKDGKTSVRHEYLIAELKDANHTIYLRIERRLQDSSAKAFGKAIIGRGSENRSRTEPAPQSNTGSDSSKQERATTTVNDGKPKKYEKNAVDEVTLYDPNSEQNKAEQKKQTLVERIVFEGADRISLAKLVVLACAINDHSKEYHFFGKNCYWFCYCVVEALKQCHLGVPQPVNGKQGSWRGLPTGHLWEEVDFGELLKKFDRMWVGFENEIDDLINNPHNKHIKVAQEQMEEERQRAEEEKKRAEESNRRAEEEARLRQEERKRAEESDRRAEEEKKRAEESDRRAADLERQLVELKAQLAGKG